MWDLTTIMWQKSWKKNSRKLRESHQEAQILKDKECSGKGIKLCGPSFGQQDT